MKLIIDTPNKELNKAIEDKVRDELRSTPQSNPRKPETTILEDMEHIMSLVEKHKKLKKGEIDV
jgi:hypothetical protein